MKKLNISKRTLLVYLVSVFVFLIFSTLSLLYIQKKLYSYNFPLVTGRVLGPEYNMSYLKALGECDMATNGFGCFEKVMKNSILYEKDFSVEKAYLKLTDMIYADKLTTRDCHYISHEIGPYVLSRYGLEGGLKIDLHSKNISDFCMAGYYHGIFIAYARSSSNFLTKIKEIAIKNDIDVYKSEVSIKEKYKHHTMVHGLGHGIFSKYGDVKESVKVCESLFTINENLESCITGVFMQDYIETYEVGLDKPVDYCTAYPDYFSECLIGSSVPPPILEAEKQTERTNQEIEFCKNIGEAKDVFQCFSVFFFKDRMGPDFLKQNKGKICDEILYEKRFLCDLAYFVTVGYYTQILLPEGTFKYDENLFAKKLCLNLNPLDYLKCRKKLLEKLKAGTFIPAKEEDMSIPELNLSDLKFFYK